MADTAFKYFTVFGISMFKFLFGPLSGAGLGLSYWESCGLTIAGMMTTVSILGVLGKPARDKIFNRFFKRKKLFTPANRRIVRVWKSSGIKGVAFLTPILLTPIGGVLIALSFGVKTKELFFYMLGSAIFWGMSFTGLVYYIGLDIFHKMFSLW